MQVRIALIADIHGNASALRALERDLERVRPDEVWCLGDAIGKGAESDLTLDWVFAHCTRFLLGNWELGVIERMFPNDCVYWHQLGDERMERLRALPMETEITLSGHRIRLIHGRPIMRQWPMRGTEDESVYEELFRPRPGDVYDTLIFADNHRQSSRAMSLGMLYNTGSVGNAIGQTGAFYAVMEGDPDDAAAPFEMRMRHLSYDPEPSIEAARLFFGEEDRRYQCLCEELRTAVYQKR